MTIMAIEFATADEAFQHLDASGEGGLVVTVAGRYLITDKAEAHRMQDAGVEFAYLCLHERPDGRETIVSVPVN